MNIFIKSGCRCILYVHVNFGSQECAGGGGTVIQVSKDTKCVFQHDRKGGLKEGISKRLEEDTTIG